jgi:hypothetical protein
MSASASGGVDSPWKDEARAGHVECNQIAPGVMAKLMGEDLRGYLTRPISVARLMQQTKNKQQIWWAEDGEEKPSVR